MCIDIDRIIDYLSSKNEKNVQAEGIELARKIKHLSVLIMPIEDKSTWENCAKVLISKSDRELEPYFLSLFEWLQDMNWPGASLIYDRLLGVNEESLLLSHKTSLNIAIRTNDAIWKRVLDDFLTDYTETRG